MKPQRPLTLKPVIISGRVIHGDHYGRVLGFPTANLDRRSFSRRKMKVKLGVWAGRVFLSSRPNPHFLSVLENGGEWRDPLTKKYKRFLHSARFLKTIKKANLGRNDRALYPAAVVIGPLDKSGLPKVEAHLLNFKGNLYGKKITLVLKQYLRPFKKYDSVEELRKQIREDISKVKRMLQ